MYMVGMLFNNTLYYIVSNNFIFNLLDFIIGNSIFATIVILACSIIFKFCIWHKLIIIANFINIIIAYVDKTFNIPITDIKLLVLYYIVYSIVLLIITYIHNKNNKYARNKIKNIKGII